MILFVNAKINIGLNIVGKREDGYHNLETIFYPIGIGSGTPLHPEPFGDIIEIIKKPEFDCGLSFNFYGRKINCDLKQNLVVKAANKFIDTLSHENNSAEARVNFDITLDKHIPDGAGLGGGSADAAFTLKGLNEIMGKPFSTERLKTLAVSLGADCAFFIYNRPCFAEGIGDILKPVSLDLKGHYMLIVKPPIHVSTKDAFSGVKPRKPCFDLKELPSLPLSEWKEFVINDFEVTVFHKFPELAALKDSLYVEGAIYASMSGSGASLYGIFDEKEKAEKLRNRLLSTYSDVWLFGL